MALGEAIPGQYPIPIPSFWVIFASFCFVFAPRTVPNRFWIVSSADTWRNFAKACERFAKFSSKFANSLFPIFLSANTLNLVKAVPSVAKINEKNKIEMKNENGK